MITILYGAENIYINVTDIVLNNMIKDDVIYIPSGDDNRVQIFTDPIQGVYKIIIILYMNELSFVYNHLQEIRMDLKIYNKLINIQNKLKLDFGDFRIEVPEQIMSLTYLTGNEKVLEIGGNIGRNSLIISYILNNNGNNNLVTLESSYDSSQKLIHNRNINNMNFFIENSALSKRKLIQKDWNTIESDVILDGYEPVNTITYEELNKKYNIIFDTLVLDCEGAFYYILMDMPEILNNITLIIIENDFKDISQKKYVDYVLKNNNFVVDYTEMCIAADWSDCQQNFFEVWKRKI